MSPDSPIVVGKLRLMQEIANKRHMLKNFSSFGETQAEIRLVKLEPTHGLFVKMLGLTNTQIGKFCAYYGPVVFRYGLAIFFDGDIFFGAAPVSPLQGFLISSDL